MKISPAKTIQNSTLNINNLVKSTKYGLSHEKN